MLVGEIIAQANHALALRESKNNCIQLAVVEVVSASIARIVGSQGTRLAGWLQSSRLLTYSELVLFFCMHSVFKHNLTLFC